VVRPLKLGRALAYAPFQRLVELAHGCYGLPEAALMHLERRQTLAEEVGGALGHFGALFRRMRMEQGSHQRHLMELGHLQHAKPPRKRHPADLIGLSERRFTLSIEKLP